MIGEADDISKNAYIKLIKYFLNIKLSIFIHHTTKKRDRNVLYSRYLLSFSFISTPKC